MPPKKRTTTRKTGGASLPKAFRSIPSISKIFDEVATSQDNAAGALFAETLKRQVETAKLELHGYAVDQIHLLFEGNIENQIADLVTRQRVSTSPVETSATTRPVRASRVKRSVKKEVEDFAHKITETLTENDAETAVSSEDVLDEVDMETEDNDVTPEARVHRLNTPPISSEMTDAEFEELAVPRTLIRMQQMSISRKVEAFSSSSRSTVCQGTPKRNNARDGVANTATPRQVFPTTPARNATAAPSSSKTPRRVPTESKLKHAEDLRLKMLEEKRDRARKKAEAQRANVLERKREMEKQRLEKLEEQRRKDEKAANFMKAQREMKSPTRARLAVAEPRTPSSKCTAARKVFQTETNVPTPGRGPAKRGRIEVAVGKGQKTTVAEPTVNLSPSRNLPRSNSRHIKQEPMEICSTSPPPQTKLAKPKAKAKRSHNAATSDANGAAKADAAKAEADKLRAEQERYLLNQAEEEKARAAAEEQRRKEKRAAEKKAEAARRHQEEEMAKLKAIEAAEAKRLREQSEREEKELQETLKLQAEKKARQEKLGRTPPPAVYEMTPPRTYKAQSKNDYGLHDLNSDDETDQEDDPRKEVPAWADFAVVRKKVREHIDNPPFDVSDFFGEIQKPDLKLIFGDSIKLKKRGSSAVWKSPAVSNTHTQNVRRVLDEIRE